MFQALNGLAPPHLNELISPRSHTRTLRSSSESLFSVPTCNQAFGDRAFSVYAPQLWNTPATHQGIRYRLSIQKAAEYTCLSSRLVDILCYIVKRSERILKLDLALYEIHLF